MQIVLSLGRQVPEEADTTATVKRKTVEVQERQLASMIRKISQKAVTTMVGTSHATEQMDL